MKALALRVRGPLYSSKSAPRELLSYQVAICPPLPLPAALLGALIRAYARLDRSVSKDKVDKAAVEYLERFKKYGISATCKLSSDSSLIKGAILLKRFRTLEATPPKGEEKSDAMRREYIFHNKLDIFYLFDSPPDDFKKIEQAGYLIDRMGDTESLITVEEIITVNNQNPVNDREVEINTVTPFDLLDEHPSNGMIWNGLAESIYPGREARPGAFVLPLETRVSKGSEYFVGCSFQAKIKEGVNVHSFEFKGETITVISWAAQQITYKTEQRKKTKDGRGKGKRNF
ncbi:MAG TPA: type I-A CRISPR-associated protein Cas5a [Candidatus Limnocylindrales bacterium]|nr:type I-A CRISPR-associated protein Cas5a [Candidatus Limnocylindrales bacterium]